MNELALFAGAGGGILAGQMLGWRCVCAVEIEPYPASVLAARQNDGLLPPFPIWNDVSTFDGKPWRGIVDVVSGGFPCQDISIAGKGDGLDGERSGLWTEFARIISEVRPRYAFIENSPMLTLRGLDRVLCDLAALRYDAKWAVISAADIGAPHLRERIWIVGNTNDYGQPAAEIARGTAERGNASTARQNQTEQSARPGMQHAELADTTSQRVERSRTAGQQKSQTPPRERISGCDCTGSRAGHWLPEPDVDRIKAIGNGQVPQCAAEAWRILSGANQRKNIGDNHGHSIYCEVCGEKL